MEPLMEPLGGTDSLSGVRVTTTARSKEPEPGLFFQDVGTPDMNCNPQNMTGRKFENPAELPASRSAPQSAYAAGSFDIHWIPLRQAIAYVRVHHRHSPRVTGGIVALGCWVADELVGVAILGRGARLDSARLVEITRVCTNGHEHACSALYSKAKRLGQALGFLKIKTFTRLHESGASLRAIGAKEDGTTKAQVWDRPSRRREGGDMEIKQRWAL